MPGTGSADRFGTDAAVADWAVGEGWLSWANVAIGNTLPDALAGGAFIGKLGGPMLYTDKQPLNAQTRAVLQANRDVVPDVWVFGGPAAVADTTQRAHRRDPSSARVRATRVGVQSPNPHPGRADSAPSRRTRYALDVSQSGKEVLMRIIVVLGARPNFIKAGPLMPALAEAGIDAGIAHTGQHYDASLSDVFFADLRIPEPRWLLGVGSGTHAVQTGVAMMRLEELFVEERPDAVVVVGDVNSTLAGALAAAKIGLPVVHLEAGLRSGDMSMPEEVNRLVTDQLSAMLLAPTRDAVDHLAGEGVGAHRVHFVGNIMAESVVRNYERACARETCTRYGVTSGGYVLATVHRPENTDAADNLAAIVSALAASPLPVLFPVHPRTRAKLEAASVAAGGAIRAIDPVGYLDMLSLQCDAGAVVTDSGGVQEESCVVHTPCVTVRRNTERQVTLEVGSNRLVGADRSAITAALQDALASRRDWTLPERWDSEVSARIVEALDSGVIPLAGG